MVNSRNLKIGIVFDDSLDKPDGVQQYILTVGNWLLSEGHEVHYLVGKTVRKDIPNVYSLSRNINVTANGNQMSIPLPTSRRKLKQHLNAQQYDVLHVQVPYSPWLAHRIILAAPNSTRIVGTFHIVAFSKLIKLATKLLSMWTKRSSVKFSRIVSVSTAASEYALDTYGITTKVVPNVFDFKRFESAAPLLPLIEPIRILFLGRLVERKGCQDLLEAIRILVTNADIPEFRVVVCGKGPELYKLKAYALAHSLPVEFAGFVTEKDKPGYYASADISVFPSTGGESFGIVLLEAMASGKSAVIGARNSGYESVMSQRPSQLFKIHDPQDLAHLLQILMQDNKLRAEYAAWGLEFSRQYDIHTVGKHIIMLYLGDKKLL